LAIRLILRNRIDILKIRRKVTRDMAEQFKANNNLDLFLETSAKTGFNARNV
jgi:hypothetical protein